MPIDKIYCGIEALPKGKIRGSMKECIEKNQVRYWGLKKIDSRLISSMSTSKNVPSTRRKLIEKAVVIDAKIKNLIKKLKFSKNMTDSEKEKINNDMKKFKEQRKKLKDELKKKENDKEKSKSKTQKGGNKMDHFDKINIIFKLEKLFSKKLSNKKEKKIDLHYNNLFKDLNKLKEEKNEYFSNTLKKNLSNKKFINKTIKIYINNIEKID